MPLFRVTIYFEPPDLKGDAEASYEVDVEADDESDAVDKATAISVLGYSAELIDEENG